MFAWNGETAPPDAIAWKLPPTGGRRPSNESRIDADAGRARSRLGLGELNRWMFLGDGIDSDRVVRVAAQGPSQQNRSRRQT
jgi:hypothetical protein